MSELGPVPPALQALYDDERTAPIGGAEERERVRNRVLATVGVAAGVGAAGSVASAASASGTAAAGTAAAGTAAAAGALGATIAGKIVIVAVAFGALGGGLYGLATSSSSSPSLSLDQRSIVAPPEAAPTPRSGPIALAAVAPSSRLEASAPASSASPSAPGASLRTQSRPSSSPSSELAPAPEPPAPRQRARSAAPENARTTSSQLAQLAHAWEALRRGEVEAALALVERDRIAHPESGFAEEREAIRIVALHRLHRHAEARSGARAFTARYPNSIHRSRIALALEETP